MCQRHRLLDATEFPHENPLRGRYLQIRCTLGALTIVLHNVYAPVACTDRAAFIDALPRDFPPHFLHIAGGDFNCILNKDLDSQSPSAATMAGSHELTAWMHDLGISQTVNRLDYVFCSSRLARLTHWRATHLPHIPQADHVGCQIITKRQSTRHGCGPWKAPSWLLKLPRAAEIIHGCLDRFLDKSPSFRNLAKAYDTLVSDIRKQLKEFHTQQVDKQQLPMKKLAFEIAALLQVPNIRQDPVQVDRVRELQQQIEKLQMAQREFRQEQAFQIHLYKELSQLEFDEAGCLE
ncbi:Aste57867_5523 [Aphanomyces stellatus]|uniref:Aste57867_5523 protein n=1 Tax=Aphanomyces stellatus TaxID=120398 RepID=A0A485KHC1_9STRA|nr:hypothetical protein As57867_005510 [Aphanomyces stellatus]VFT82573.1 Aste57867_5523 [Aphanomyces stellatus]